MKKSVVLKIKNYIYVLVKSNEFILAFDKNTWLRQNCKNYQIPLNNDNISPKQNFLPCNSQLFVAINFL